MRPARHEALDLADGHSAASNLLCKRQTLVRVDDAEKRASMAGSDATFGDQLLDGIVETQKAERVGDGSSVLAGALGHLLLREMEFVAELLKGASLFNGVQIFALEIFDERHLERHFFWDVANDGGHALQRGALCRAPAAFAGDKLKTRADAADNERLDDAARTDRAGELVERFFAEARARLIGARIDQVYIDADEALTEGRLRCCRCSRCRQCCCRSYRRLLLRRRGRHLARLRFGLPNQCAQPPAQGVSGHCE